MEIDGTRQTTILAIKEVSHDNKPHYEKYQGKKELDSQFIHQHRLLHKNYLGQFSKYFFHNYNIQYYQQTANNSREIKKQNMADL